ncbi:WUSCHEL-related homeobox 11 [Andrographis paniculata]|uniref:WUSCHEL-related homeobox 11 n=1 Tax=Andrographis paniculata TaxID=175694 RepID=UPI0021E9A388|nr:WUSCHEL-related homeobox 11 [Andrographis paniculata]
MDDHHHSPHPRGGAAVEPVRSRWSPKPEQILILESIFNSGMVNPPKDETVRIRKLLEKFGAVGDANVFYWFQNRRSRSRRRQRQIQASLAAAGEDQPQQVQPQPQPQFDQIGTNCNFPIGSSLVGSSSSSGGFSGGNSDGLFSLSSEHHAAGLSPEYDQAPAFAPNNSSSSFNNYQSEVMTVFINGVATEVGRGPLDVRAMCGGDLMLVHSSGMAVQMNDYGYALLHSGESYFLVPRHS